MARGQGIHWQDIYWTKLLHLPKRWFSVSGNPKIKEWCLRKGWHFQFSWFIQIHPLTCFPFSNKVYIPFNKGSKCNHLQKVTSLSPCLFTSCCSMDKIECSQRKISLAIPVFLSSFSLHFVFLEDWTRFNGQSWDFVFFTIFKVSLYHGRDDVYQEMIFMLCVEPNPSKN